LVPRSPNNNKLAELIGWLKAEDFFEPLHRRLYEAMCRLWSEGRPFVPSIIVPLFPNEPPIGELSFKQYLGRLMASVTSLKATKGFAHTMKELAGRRRLCGISAGLQEQASNPGIGVLEAAIDAVSGLNDVISSSRPRRTCVTAYEAAGELIADLEDGASEIAIPTGLADLDRVTGGWHYSQLAYIGGRPSMGKSTLMIEPGQITRSSPRLLSWLACHPMLVQFPQLAKDTETVSGSVASPVATARFKPLMD
jgi:replicative DNA helicase